MFKRGKKITRKDVPEHEHKFAKFALIDKLPHKVCSCGASQQVMFISAVNNYDEYLGFYGEEKKRIAQARKAKGLDYSDGHNELEED